MRTTIKNASKNSFIIGVGSVLNIVPVHSKQSSRLLVHPDTHVLSSDWKQIGKDFKSAMKSVK